MEPRIRVSAIFAGRAACCSAGRRSPGKEYWLLPGGGVDSGETLIEALAASCARSSVSRPTCSSKAVALVDSIAPETLGRAKHVVHVIFAADLSHRSFHDVETKDAAIRGPDFLDEELDDVMLHPPISDFSPLAVGRSGCLSRRPLGAARSFSRTTPIRPRGRRAARRPGHTAAMAQPPCSLDDLSEPTARRSGRPRVSLVGANGERWRAVGLGETVGDAFDLGAGERADRHLVARQ